MDSFRYFIKKMLQLCIFYILLHAATSAVEYGYEGDLDDQPEFTYYTRQSKQQRYDQILSKLHSLFKERSADNNGNSKSVEDYNDFNYNHINNDKKELDEVLAEVTTVLGKIKEQLKKINKDGVLTVGLPVDKNERRYKRDVTNDTITNTTLTEQNVTATATSTEKLATVIDKVKLLRSKNDTVKTEVLRANNDTDSSLSGRRMIPMNPMMEAPPHFVTTTSRVKSKLLSYLEDTFNEVERKIKPLTNIKIALSNDDHYRIGYIIATIDTLEVNMKKFKNDMNLHQQFWDDEKILDLFDRIKATNTVATSLIESLKKYLPRN